MKHIPFLVISCFLIVQLSFAQDKTMKQLQGEASKTITKDANDTISKTWKKGGLFNLNLNQGALSNWAAGGDKSSLSVAALLNLYAYYKKDRRQWDNTMNLSYGFINTTSLGNRKADDRIDLLSKYSYELHKQWYLSGLFNFRTQFSSGYAYPHSGTKVLTSDFFAPAYILLSPGITYQPCDCFSLFASPVTARWIIVQNDSLSRAKAYGVDSSKKSKLEIGAFASASYKAKLGASATFQGRLDLFSNYQNNPQDISLFWTNMLLVKVTKIITMSLNVDMIYDNDVKTVKSDGTTGGPALQLKEVMGIGIACTF